MLISKSDLLSDKALGESPREASIIEKSLTNELWCFYFCCCSCFYLTNSSVTTLHSLKKNRLNEKNICFATRKRRICSKEIIFVCFNSLSNEIWMKRKLFLLNKRGACRWRNKFSFDQNDFFQCWYFNNWSFDPSKLISTRETWRVE